MTTPTISITNGRQIVNNAQLVKVGNAYVLTADMATKRAEISAYSGCHFYLSSSDETLHDDPTKPDTIVRVEGLSDDYTVEATVSRYTLVAFFYPRSVYEPDNADIVSRWPEETATPDTTPA